MPSNFGRDVRIGVRQLLHSYVRGILSTGQRPTLVTGEAVTANYFELLGIAPAAGRGFHADENSAPGASPVLVLSHGLWQRQFGARPDIVGQVVTVSGLGYTVVGVAPAALTGTLPGISSAPSRESRLAPRGLTGVCCLSLPARSGHRLACLAN